MSPIEPPISIQKIQSKVKWALFWLKARVMFKIVLIMDKHGNVDEKDPRFVKITKNTEARLLKILQKYRTQLQTPQASDISIDIAYLLDLIYRKLDYIAQNAEKLMESQTRDPHLFFSQQDYYQIFNLNFLVYCLEHLGNIHLPLEWFRTDKVELQNYLHNKITIAFSHPILISLLFPNVDFPALKNAYEGFKSAIKLDDNAKIIGNKYRIPLKAESIEISVFYHQYGLKELPPNCLHTLKHTDFIDCGAYIGDSALIFNEFGARSIHCFEPNPQNCELLLETMELNRLSNVKVNRMGVGNSLKPAKIALMGSGSYITSFKGEKIPMTTLDKYCLEHGLDVGLIKMDIEGFETSAIKGARNIIIQHKPILLISVYHDAQDFFEVPVLLKEWVPEYQFRFLNLDRDDPLMERVLLAYIDRE